MNEENTAKEKFSMENLTNILKPIFSWLLKSNLSLCLSFSVCINVKNQM